MFDPACLQLSPLFQLLAIQQAHVLLSDWSCHRLGGFLSVDLTLKWVQLIKGAVEGKPESIMFCIKTDISGEGNAQMSYLYVYVVLSSDDGGGIPSSEEEYL